MELSIELLISAMICSPLVMLPFCLVQADHYLRAFVFMLIGLSTSSAAIWVLALRVLSSNQGVFAFDQLIYVDALSSYHLLVLTLVYLLCSLYATIYFRHAEFPAKMARQFHALWLLSFVAMVFVLISNNIALMWVGIEATTLLTAFLICIKISPVSLEATWKYLIICSVGVAFAFIGILLLTASAHGVFPDIEHALLWTSMRDVSSRLNPAFLKVSFIFLLVGYGTKAGLAPMHTWLPDAHSQAPAPVSALFSGFLLNGALYCVMRFVPIVDGGSGVNGWAHTLMTVVGGFSILVAAVFILFQTDVKRLLAYSSVEHIGIIALGVGLGGLGTMAALFHVVNHSMCKMLSFFSAGRVGQIYGTHKMNLLGRTLEGSGLWGLGLFLGLLALIGMVPFSIFMSEFWLIKTAVHSRKWFLLVIFLVGISVVFIGALQHALHMAWGKSTRVASERNFSKFEYFLVVFCVTIILFLGLWMPQFFLKWLSLAAQIVEGVRP